MVEITARNAPRAYQEALWKMRICAVEEASQRGPVMTIREPVLLTIKRPAERVLLDPVRNANPFFHVMEFVWMMSGSKRVDWIAQFNKTLLKSANEGEIHGAYGHRWIKHFGHNQLQFAINTLKKDPTTRRVVLEMWDSAVDMIPVGFLKNDYPCNTHIYLRIVGGQLYMTVCNRSNDLIWGMLGANVVHMTLLQELLAQAIGVEIGKYRVFTVNCHMYKELPNFRQIWALDQLYDIYPVEPEPLLRKDETYEQFHHDCVAFVDGDFNVMTNEWLHCTAVPIYQAYMERVHKAGDGMDHIDMISSHDWQIACEEWVRRKDAKTERHSDMRFGRDASP